jgi:hypothetical protein
MKVQALKSRRLALAFLVIGTMSLVSLVVFATAGGAANKDLGVPGSKLVPAIDVTKNGKGVSSKAIKIVFNFPIKNCDNGTAGIAPAQEDVATVLTKWVNDNIPLPGGRKLQLEPFVNDGGSDVGCAAFARAAGLKTAKQIGAFADIGNSTNRDGNSVYAQTVTANGTVDIAQAASFQLTKDFTDRWPYAWGIQPAGDASFQPLAWFIGKRVKGTQYVADNGTKSARKWGLISFDGSIGNGVAAAAKKYLQSVGITPKVYSVSTDPTTMAQQVTSLAASIKSAGINSIVYAVNDATTDEDIANAFNSQNLFPDWYISDYSLLVKLAVYAAPLFPKQNLRLHGTSLPDITAARIDVNPNGSNGKSANLQDNSWRIAATTAYKQAGGTSSNPQNGSDLQGIWDALSTLTIGIENAGKTLNAFTFANGLSKANSCEKQQFFGQDQLQSPVPEFSKTQPWVLHGFTTYYWQDQRQSVWSPSTGGYLDSYDGYELFLTQKSLPTKPIWDTGAHNGVYPYNAQTQGRFTINMKCPVPKS